MAASENGLFFVHEFKSIYTEYTIEMIVPEGYLTWFVIARSQAKLGLGQAAANAKIRGSRCLPVRAYVIYCYCILSRNNCKPIRKPLAIQTHLIYAVLYKMSVSIRGNITNPTLKKN